MRVKTKHFYEFGGFRLNVDERLLLRDDEVVPLAPKALDLLVVLVENSSHVLSKDELMKRVWSDSFVEEANLSHHVFTLRKALGEDRNGAKFIETIPRRGYRFVANVTEIQDEPDVVLVEEYSRSRIVIEEETETGDAANLQSARAVPLSRSEQRQVKLVRPVQSFLPPWLSGWRAVLLLSGVIIAAALILWSAFFKSDKADSLSKDKKTVLSPRSSMKITRMTSSGKVANATISADGKFIAYSQNYTEGLGTLWVRQVGTNSEVQLLPPDDRIFGGIAFSLDGAFVYYTVYHPDDPNGALYRVPVLGGPATRLIRNFSSMFTLSPDGQRVAFYRNDADGKRKHLMIAALDGSSEQLLMTRDRRKLYFSAIPAWSPDGKLIAFGAAVDAEVQDQDHPVSLFTLDIHTQDVKRITNEQWGEVGKTVWTPDGRGLVFVASRRRIGNQLFSLSYPDGELSRITNDLLTYGNYGMGITADASTLVADIYETSAQLWTIGVDGDVSQANLLTTGKNDGAAGLAGLPDGRIVFASRAGDDSDLWVRRDDGPETKPLTSDSYFEGGLCATPDGRYLIFSSDRAGGSHIFRMNADGSQLMQLTSGAGYDTAPDCSPDGKWVVYVSHSGETKTIWKVSIEGGNPVQLADFESLAPSFSPDGRFIACIIPSDSRVKNGSIAVIPAEGGAPLKSFTVIPFRYSYVSARWTPDGQALVYLVKDKNANNLWKQPLAGGASERLTNFNTDYILNYAYSRDGKRIILSRGQYIGNVVLIKNFR